MRKLSAIFALVFIFCVGAFAQDHSKAEVFGGYQLTSIDDSIDGNGRVALNGWDAALTGYIKPHLGITADISGAYGNPNFNSTGGLDVSFKNHYFLFGPTYRTSATDRASVFAHALFGAAHSNGNFAGFTSTDNSFAMALGGGLDLKANRNVSFRVGQLDYLYTRFTGVKQNNFRYSAGLVFHF